MRDLNSKVQDTNTKSKEGWPRALRSSLLIYISLLIFHGYIFGYSDQIEMIPLIWAMGHGDAYSTDFFIQHIINKPIHERWFFIQFLYQFKLSHPISIFIIHAVSSIALLLGLHAIAARFIRTGWIRWAAIITTLLLTYNINLGGNELYYNLLIPSLPAKAFGAWAIFQALKNNWIASMILLTLACYLQPLVGLQLWLLLVLSGLLYAIIETKDQVKRIILAGLIFISFAGPWLFLLFNQHDQGELSNALLFDIIECRLSHHFFPGWFSIKGYLLLTILAGFGIYFFYLKEKMLSFFIGWIIVGCAVYTVGVELLKSSLVLDTQWFKSTIWVKFLGFVAIFSMLENYFLKSIFNKKISGISFSITLIFLLAIIKISPLPFIKDRPSDYPWHHALNTEQDISLQAKALSNEDELFIIPPDFTAFKWYSKRNSYVDFKAMIHHKDVLGLWYERIKEVYGYDLKQKLEGRQINEIYKDHWQSMNANDWEKLKLKGIQYVIAPNLVSIPFKKIKENEDYSIYELVN